MSNRANTDARAAAVSRIVSKRADEMCRRSIETRRAISEATGRDFTQPCPLCPYRSCIVEDDGTIHPAPTKPDPSRH